MHVQDTFNRVGNCQIIKSCGCSWLRWGDGLVQVLGLRLLDALKPGGGLVDGLTWVVLNYLDLICWQALAQVQDAVGVVRVEQELGAAESRAPHHSVIATKEVLREEVIIGAGPWMQAPVVNVKHHDLIRVICDEEFLLIWADGHGQRLASHLGQSPIDLLLFKVKHDKIGDKCHNKILVPELAQIKDFIILLYFPYNLSKVGDYLKGQILHIYSIDFQVISNHGNLPFFLNISLYFDVLCCRQSLEAIL
jgi:hypothetical protein